jgi:predicted GTPase
MTLEELEREDKIKHLLEAPAPIVVGKLIAELRRYIEHYGVLPLSPGIDLYERDGNYEV